MFCGIQYFEHWLRSFQGELKVHVPDESYETKYLGGNNKTRKQYLRMKNIIIGAVDGCCRLRIAHDSEHIWSFEIIKHLW